MDIMFAEKHPQSLLRLASGRIPLKRLLHDGGAFAVNEYSLGAIVVDVADWGGAGIFTPADFFAQTALGVFGKRINVVFTLAKGDGV